MQILHGNFTSAFSLVYCDKFSNEKPSLNHESVPNLNFISFLFLGNHTRTRLWLNVPLFDFGRLAGMEKFLF